jgi:hypothetical protein
MRRALHALLMIPLVAALPYACSHSDEETPTPGYEDVAYEGKVTDESLLALDQGAPAEGGAGAPQLTEPTAAEQSAETAPTFRWTFATAGARRDPVELLRPGAPAPAPRWAGPLRELLGPARELLGPARELVGPLRELVGPLRAAHAHGTPYSGQATLLVFSTDADPKLLRVFTSETSYTPTDATWRKLVDAKAPITLSLTGAAFEQNRLAQGTQPRLGTPYQFTIGG